jgi:hypothetical protein
MAGDDLDPQARSVHACGDPSFAEAAVGGKPSPRRLKYRQSYNCNVNLF